MKFKQFILLLFIVSLLPLTMNVMKVNAMSAKVSTEELTEEEKNTFLSNIGITLLITEPNKNTFSCFDVNEQGMIAIGRDTPDTKTICIYSSEGVFLYGYKFSCSQSYLVEWVDQYINIYFSRSDVRISVDSAGNILDIKSIQNTIENNTYLNYLKSTSVIVGDDRYEIRNDMGILNWFAFSYSQIVIIDDSGAENIIYDVNTMQLSKTIFTVTSFIAFFTVAVIVILRGIIKFEQKRIC